MFKVSTDVRIEELSCPPAPSDPRDEGGCHLRLVTGQLRRGGGEANLLTATWSQPQMGDDINKAELVLVVTTQQMAECENDPLGQIYTR